MDTQKELRVTFRIEDWNELKEQKGDRPWRKAILEEFGVIEK